MSRRGAVTGCREDLAEDFAQRLDEAKVNRAYLRLRKTIGDAISSK
jgi:hypothetical protein